MPQTGITAYFVRRLKNPDLSTCWLNSCLQLILSGLDYSPLEMRFESELGARLYDLKNHDPKMCIDPTEIQDIIIFTEDMRIASRKSELTDHIRDKKVLSKMLENIDQMYLNLMTGQQCVRDLFICIKENMENWLDVYGMFSFITVNLTICSACRYRSM